ncbi:MAG TPA: class I SAM-dependent methyltransferase [Acidimicrobiia bacterium]|jgi:SAM-dependent methyltransferase
MAEPATPYIFDNSDEREAERLAGIQAAWDAGTFRHLTDLGVGHGWRCLEVGAGAGSVARWLCERVGEKGSVLATDINTALLDGLDFPNLEVRRHDIQSEELPWGEFDLVHCRLVLMHLPAREEALARMADALAPGGWMLVEDVSFAGTGTATRRGSATFRSLIVPLRAMLRAHGADGRRLPVLFNRLGLTEVGAEGRVVVLVGGSEDNAWALPTLERIQERLTGGEGQEPSKVRAAFERVPALRRAAERQLVRLRQLLDDPEFAFHCPAMVAAWGRRPVSPGSGR